MRKSLFFARNGRTHELVSLNRFEAPNRVAGDVSAGAKAVTMETYKVCEVESVDQRLYIQRATVLLSVDIAGTLDRFDRLRAANESEPARWQ